MKIRINRFAEYISSRRFAIILLVVTTLIILTANLIPNPLLMPKEEAERFIRERPALFEISKKFHVMNITRSPLFLVVPAFVLLSITICTYKRAMRGFRAGKDIPSVEGLRHSYRGRTGIAEAMPVLEKNGWSVTKREDGDLLLLYSRKGKGGIWGSVVFHAGMNIVIIGGIVSMMTQFNRELPLTEGFESEPLNVLKKLSGWEMNTFPYKKIYLRAFAAAYAGESFALDYTAAIETMDKAGNVKEETIKVNQPLTKAGYQFLLDRYYFAPRFVITEKKDGKVVQDACINLLVSNPDQTDEFEVQGTRIRVRARFFPDFYTEGGTVGTRTRNLNNPAFVLEFIKGKDMIGSGLLPLHKRMDFDEGRYTIEFRDLREWIILAISKDYGLPFFEAGLLLVVLGLVVRFFLNDKSIWVVVRKETGIMELGGKALYFPALFEEEIRRISEELGLNERD